MKAVVVGGTGLVGEALLRALMSDPAYTQIVSLARREHEAPPRVEVQVGFDVPKGMDVGFCALGTTIKSAGSQAAFRAVDHDLVLQFARGCKASGARGMHVVSSIGADPRSHIFYSRVKGEMERDLKALDLTSCCAYRPSFLMGERHERRAGERFGIAAARVLKPVIPKRYRGIEAETVARAMAANAKLEPAGWHALTNVDIEALARRT